LPEHRNDYSAGALKRLVTSKLLPPYSQINQNILTHFKHACPSDHFTFNVIRTTVIVRTISLAKETSPRGLFPTSSM